MLVGNCLSELHCLVMIEGDDSMTCRDIAVVTIWRCLGFATIRRIYPRVDHSPVARFFSSRLVGRKRIRVMRKKGDAAFGSYIGAPKLLQREIEDVGSRSV